MQYIIADSSDYSEVNRSLDIDYPARIGQVIRLRNGRSYKIIDVEFVQRPDDSLAVRGQLAQID